MLPLTKAAQGSVHTVKWAFGLPEIMEKLETLKIHQGSRILVVQKDKDYMIIEAEEKELSSKTRWQAGFRYKKTEIQKMTP